MALPRTREEFKQHCLRRLGHPVVQINVSDEQVEDRIDYSLLYYQDYHFDGSEVVYYKQQITQQHKDDGYITLPENIIGAVRVFPIGDPSIRSDDMFNIRYQIALNDLYTLTSVSMVPYYMAMQHIGLIQEILVGQQPIRFNRHTNRLYIDQDWDRIAVGEYILVEAYSVLDPETYADIWSDRWLIRYATEQIKYQYGENLSKYSGVALPGGVTLNGDKIKDEARAEIEKLESEMINSYSLPVSDFVG